MIPQLSGVDLQTFRKPRVAVTKINVIDQPGSLEIGTDAVLIAAMDEYLSFRNFRQSSVLAERFDYPMICSTMSASGSSRMRGKLTSCASCCWRRGSTTSSPTTGSNWNASSAPPRSSISLNSPSSSKSRRWSAPATKIVGQPADTDSVKAAVIVRDGGRCRDCYSAVNLQINHIVPLSKGGSSEESNLQTLCRRCNRRKWKKLVPRF